MTARKNARPKTYERQAPPQPRLAESQPQPAPDAEAPGPETATSRFDPDRELILRLVEMVKAL